MGTIEVKVLSDFPDVRAVDWSKNVAQFEHTKGIEVLPPFLQGSCDLPLGNNCVRLISPQKVRVVDQNNVPVAHFTKLGWSGAGPTEWPKGSPLTGS